ncbi:hypothetical protein L6452_39328 [Arctium lappa]|uniref:Uncharacterized protein n=1 Tax=Arctium lappa TaxID=4217 RepID=A0ACB8XSF2_ARCLA|nr:hypothetical protein L6452_39328 [Arctium lappa]
MEHSPLENIDRETTGVSPNPKKVLTKEQVEHVGSEAHTIDFAQSAEQDNMNIPKTFPTANLGEQSSKGPRCQETKGVEASSARQRTPTKSSSDPPRVVNTPKGGEDRYTYDELMETLANINEDVLSQGKLIEEMQQIILSQQVQISNLRKLVLKQVQKKKRTKFILKKRSILHDASKKGENKGESRAGSDKQSPDGMKSTVEGEQGNEIGTAAKTFKQAAQSGLAAVTEPAAVIGISVEEIEIA